MNIHIESPRLEIEDKLRELVQAKFLHLDKLYRRIEEASVILRKVNDDRDKNFKIEARLLVPQKTIFASEQEESFEEALNKLVADLEHQLRKHKEEMEEVR